MQSALLIAEKPDLQRKIQEVYNNHKSEISYYCDFSAQRGHLVTLMLPDEIDEKQAEWSWENLPFEPENFGGWKYKLIKEKKQGNFLTAQERYEEMKKKID
ncbi:MAG: hypothetical protein J6O61_19255, partial [Butyrivibrio sp.]|nr:hypothetical protein [Butyrivibrio sp.]